MFRWLCLCGALLLCALVLPAQNLNTTFRSKMTFTGQTLANVWGYTANGREYALLGARNGLIIVDITDPDNPTYTRDTRTILTGFQVLPPDGK